MALPRGSSLDLQEFRDGLAKWSRTKAQGDPGLDRIAGAREVLRLYRGDLLAEDTYEEYAAESRERLRTLWQEGSATLSRELMEVSPHEAEQLLLRGLESDPYWTEGIALLITSLRGRGRVLAAIRLYRDYEKRLLEDLGLEPDPPLQALFRTLTESR
jgi:two-component SAPR family response regulator